VETRKLAAILCSDVVGYSKLAGADEDRILARLRDGGTLTEVARVRPCWRRCRRHHREPRTGNEPAGAEELTDQFIGITLPVDERAPSSSSRTIAPLGSEHE
jgi:hypothetical protein